MECKVNFSAGTEKKKDTTHVKALQILQDWQTGIQVPSVE